MSSPLAALRLKNLRAHFIETRKRTTEQNQPRTGAPPQWWEYRTP